MALEGIDDGWDRALLNWSSKCADPLCWIWGLGYRVVTPLDPTKFNNCESPIVEVALRVSIVAGALFATASVVIPASLLGLGVASRVFRAIGFALQKDNYTHIKGQAPEITLQNRAVKIMTWNICGIGAGLHLDHGGVNHWKDRIDEIVKLIISEQPDVLIFQEIYDTALSEALVEN